MKKADGYLAISKNLIVGFEDGNINNTHIFDCSCNCFTGEWSVRRTSRCGNVNRKNLNKTCVQYITSPADDIRELAKQIENEGKSTVCGQCVATLYTDGN